MDFKGGQASMNKEETAVKRVALKPGTWESLSNLKKPGQTFDDVVGSLILCEQRRRLMHDLDMAAAEPSRPWSESAKKTRALRPKL
ncbi:MAG: hypothetical protein M0Q91_16725 [Methanoregula sp.]|jgi:hypothetical protein|nr:hypothetical protein [Methanoregula sp.]